MPSSEAEADMETGRGRSCYERIGTNCVDMAASSHATSSLHMALSSASIAAAVATGIAGFESASGGTAALVAHFAFANVFLAHGSMLAACWITNAATRGSLLHLYRRFVALLIGSGFATALCLAHWYAVLAPGRVLHSESAASALDSMLWTYLVFLGTTGALQCVALGFVWYIYALKRGTDMAKCAELERLFGPILIPDGGVSCRDVPRFCRYWTCANASSEQLRESVGDRSRCIFASVSAVSDADGDGTVTREEFDRAFAGALLGGATDIDRVWSMLSMNGPRLTQEGVEAALYRLVFERRRLAFLLVTDKQVVKWAMRYFAGVAYGACGVVAMTLLGGYDSFGSGVDLFKVYLVIATYALSSMSDSVSFLASMIVHRPFNLGDVLLLDSAQVNGAASPPSANVGADIYQVSMITPSFTSMSGGTFPLQVPNRDIVSRPVRNLSTAPVNDSVRVEIAATADCQQVEQLVTKALREYAWLNPWVMDARGVDSSECNMVWGEIKTNSRFLQVNWSLIPPAYDPTFTRRLMVSARNHITRLIWNRLRMSSLMSLAAMGGAFNDKVDDFERSTALS